MVLHTMDGITMVHYALDVVGTSGGRGDFVFVGGGNDKDAYTI